MNHFAYRDGRLAAETVDLTALAEEIGTPFYVYSTATLERHYPILRRAFRRGSLIAYSVKANGNLAVLETLGAAGRRRRCRLRRQLKKALAAGICCRSIVFSEVGKTQAEMRLALAAGIHQFNVESEAELHALDGVAKACDGTGAGHAADQSRCGCALTHAKITTGTAENKFGIPWKLLLNHAGGRRKLAGHRNLVGVDVHIGSQITELTPFEDAFARVVELIGLCCAPTATPSPAPISAAGSASPIASVETLAARSSDAYGKTVRQTADRTPRRHADLRARTADRRQCRHSRLASPFI